MTGPSKVSEMGPAEVRARWSGGETGPVLIDVRNPEELSLASIPGALNVPTGDIPSRLPHLDPDRETIVFCHHGIRSAKVAAYLQQMGFTDVKSMRGGIDAWAAEIDPAVPRYT